MRSPLPLTGESPLYRGDMDEDLKRVSRNGLAEKVTGGLAWPTKMPCPAWGLSAFRCKVGSVLAQKPDTTCSRCYALRGRYVFAQVQAKLEQRYRGLFHPLWTPSMVFLIRWYADRYFRFFDSGDLQDSHHFANICTVARHVPDVRMWLPTREAAIVRSHQGEIPENLVVRLSAPAIDGARPRSWPHTSTVTTGAPRAGSFRCPAADQGNRCGECRACWDADRADISYRLH